MNKMSSKLTRNQVVATPTAVEAVTPPVVQAVKKPNAINAQEIEVGDIFSENSHYVYLRPEGTGQNKLFVLKHLESNKEVKLSPDYISALLCSADQYQTEVKVGREDKFWTAKQLSEASGFNGPIPREGDLRVKGIRNIWADIHSSQVWAVCYNKQPVALSNKRIQELLDERAAHATALIERAKTNKKSMLEAAKEAVKWMQENPVSSYEEPEERILRGYKIQFESHNGFYDVIDMDKPAPNNIRKVNINEIKWLGFNGIKYIVEK